jgi:NADP-dependent 3-hydroxy acid dehydrogenase YdfG
MADDRLKGRTALVTGASRGIGAAIAHAFAARGIRVALTSRNVDALQALAKKLGNNTFVVPCDLVDRHAVHRMADDVTKALGGAPDIIVNNAGIFELSPLYEMSETLFLETMQTNLVAPFLIVRAFLAAMRERKSGHVVTIGSIADRLIMQENGAYSPAKYGERALHEVLRLELKGSGVRATLVSPGPVDTPLWDEVLKQGHDRSLPPREAMLKPAAVADAVLYAVSQPADVNIDELRLSQS